MAAESPFYNLDQQQQTAPAASSYVPHGDISETVGRAMNMVVESSNLTGAELAIVRAALTSRGFRMKYQPIVDQAGKTVAIETLGRLLRHPDFPAEKLFPTLRVLGGMEIFNQFMIPRAFADFRLEKGNGKGMGEGPICINISKPELSFGLLDLLGTAVRESSVSPGEVCLELTEGDGGERFWEDPLSLRVLMKIQKTGFRLAIDDIISLADLDRRMIQPIGRKQLLIDSVNPLMVKVDKHVLGQHVSRTDERSLLEIVHALAILQQAHGVRFLVVLEGIETAYHLASAKALTGAYPEVSMAFQGFEVALPQTADTLH